VSVDEGEERSSASPHASCPDCAQRVSIPCARSSRNEVMACVPD
jgi:hypothetical protein